MAEGSYILRLSVLDAAASLVSETYAFVQVCHDILPPDAPTSLTLTGGIIPLYVANGQIAYISGGAEPFCTISLAEVIDENGNTLKIVNDDITVHMNGSIVGAVVLPVEIDADQVAIRINVQDRSGNVSDSAQTNFLLVDNMPPAISISSPPFDARLASGLVYIKGTAHDQGPVGIELIEARCGSDDYSAAEGTSFWTWIWLAEPGNQIVDIRATDRFGNAVQETFNFSVSSSHPSAYIVDPKPYVTIQSGSIVNITGTAFDPVDFLEYRLRYKRIDDSIYNDITLGAINFSVVDNLLEEWDTSGLDAAIYTIYLTVSDTSGNVSTYSRDIEFVSDLTFMGIPDIGVTDPFYEESAALYHAYLPDYVSPNWGADEFFLR